MAYNNMTLLKLQDSVNFGLFLEYGKYSIERETEKAFLIEVEILMKKITGEKIGKQTMEDWVAKSNCKFSNGKLYVKHWALKNSPIDVGFNELKDGETVSIQHKSMIDFATQNIEKGRSYIKKVQNRKWTKDVIRKRIEDANESILLLENLLKEIPVEITPVATN